jgi:hypothetical protein
MKQWNTLADKFARVIDGVGRHIEPGIMETVIVFNALGIHTVSSCEGHIDDGRGLILPCVDIESQQTRDLDRQIETLQLKDIQPVEREITQLRRAQADQTMIEDRWTRLDKAYTQIRELRYQARVIQCEERNKLIRYLYRFYENRTASLDQRLIITAKTMEGRTRIGSQAREDFYFAAPYELQQQKLQEAREEMRKFTDFLKEIYFSQQ